MAKTSSLFAKASILFGTVSLSLLLLLHFLSPEIDPSWHMISEYAFGAYGGILSVFFFTWALTFWSTAAAVLPFSKSIGSKIGVVLVAISGVGALMGGLFDVRHSLHGLAFGLGVPFVPIAATLLTLYFIRTYRVEKQKLLVSMWATWGTLILMAITMGIFISGMMNTGMMTAGEPQLMTEIPHGVIALIGYPNRALVIANIVWLLLMSKVLLTIESKKSK